METIGLLLDRGADKTARVRGQHAPTPHDLTSGANQSQAWGKEGPQAEIILRLRP